MVNNIFYPKSPLHDGAVIIRDGRIYAASCILPLQNYQNVYVVDYRYINQVYSGTLSQFVDERQIQDVIFVNNISATRSEALVNAMLAFIG